MVNIEKREKDVYDYIRYNHTDIYNVIYGTYSKNMFSKFRNDFEKSITNTINENLTVENIGYLAIVTFKIAYLEFSKNYMDNMLSILRHDMLNKDKVIMYDL